MQLIPSEFVVGDVYLPPLLIASLLGVAAAWGLGCHLGGPAAGA